LTCGEGNEAAPVALVDSTGSQHEYAQVGLRARPRQEVGHVAAKDRIVLDDEDAFRLRFEFQQVADGLDVVLPGAQPGGPLNDLRTPSAVVRGDFEAVIRKDANTIEASRGKGREATSKGRGVAVGDGDADGDARKGGRATNRVRGRGDGNHRLHCRPVLAWGDRFGGRHVGAAETARVPVDHAARQDQPGRVAGPEVLAGGPPPVLAGRQELDAHAGSSRTFGYRTFTWVCTLTSVLAL
jgi:hypothetical protein